MRFARQALALAGQRRPAPRAESPPSAGRRIELGYLTFGNDIRVELECYEDGDRRTAMLAATFAMAPHDRLRLTGGHEAYRAAQAAAFELIAHATELSAFWVCLHGYCRLAPSPRAPTGGRITIGGRRMARTAMPRADARKRPIARRLRSRAYVRGLKRRRRNAGRLAPPVETDRRE